MFKIMQGTTLVGIVAQPTYVKLLDNGYFGMCCAGDASGIAFDGTVYPLDEITLEQTYEATVSEEYISAKQENTELLKLVGEAVETVYQADLEVIENV